MMKIDMINSMELKYMRWNILNININLMQRIKIETIWLLIIKITVAKSNSIELNK